MFYTHRKMPQYFYEPSEPDMPHWCVALVPDDEQATVTFLPGKDNQNLAMEHAEQRAKVLNEKLND